MASWEWPLDSYSPSHLTDGMLTDKKKELTVEGDPGKIDQPAITLASTDDGRSLQLSRSLEIPVRFSSCWKISQQHVTPSQKLHEMSTQSNVSG